MIPAYLIGLREGLEAALIVGITLSVLTKLGAHHLKRVVWYGTVSAVILSIASASILQFMGSNLEGTAEEIYEGVTMVLAAIVLTWMIFWIQRQNRLQQDFESDVRKAATRGQVGGLFGIAFFAVLREGIELTLFLSAAAITATSQNVLIGGLLGLTSAGLLGWALFASTLKMNIGRFFNVTSALLILFAAGLFAHGIHEFIEVGWIPAIIDPLWDITPILSEDSFLGSLAKTLFGYNSNPSLTEVLAYLGYYLTIFLGLQRLRKRNPKTVPASL